MPPIVAKLVEVLASRKVWATVIAALCAEAGVDPDVVWALLTYVGAQGIVDAAHHLNLPSPKAVAAGAGSVVVFPEAPSNEALPKVTGLSDEEAHDRDGGPGGVQHR